MSKIKYFRHFFTTPRSTQGTVGLLENLHIILEKTSRKDVRNDILRLLFTSLDSSTIQILVRRMAQKFAYQKDIGQSFAIGFRSCLLADSCVCRSG